MIAAVNDWEQFPSDVSWFLRPGQTKAVSDPAK
jgi:hypothetical protein